MVYSNNKGTLTISCMGLAPFRDASLMSSSSCSSLKHTQSSFQYTCWMASAAHAYLHASQAGQATLPCRDARSQFPSSQTLTSGLALRQQKIVMPALHQNSHFPPPTQKTCSVWGSFQHTTGAPVQSKLSTEPVPVFRD